MKRVTMNAYTVGLMFRKGRLVRILKEGTHWVRLFDKVEIYDLTKRFELEENVDVLLQDEQFCKLVQVIDVKDGQIAFEYVEGKFVQILRPGRHIQWKSIVDYEYVLYNTSNLEVPNDVDRSLLTRLDVMTYMRVFTVSKFEKALLMVDGEFDRLIKPGVYRFWKNAMDVQVLKADVRQKQVEISGQELLTKDKAGLRMSLFVQFKVVDVVVALLENKDFEKQLYVIMQLALRKFVGGKTLDELLASKEEMSSYVVDQVKSQAKDLGLEVMEAGVRDIILPGEMKAIMNQVLVAEKQAQANTIMRREETASTRSLLNTAKLMEDNAMLLKMKEMEYVEKIADKINSISLSGGGQVIDQLRELFVVK